jgi:large subunit ribosomal protein L23
MPTHQKKIPLVRERGPKLEPHQVILRPLITEKGTHLATRTQRLAAHERTTTLGDAYCFEVNLWATKIEIKAAVKELFGVRVAKVRTQHRLGKSRRYRNMTGTMSQWKKAIVTLHPDDKIEFF